MAPKQLPIRLSPELRARLDAEAKRLDLSVNAVVVVLLDRYLPPLAGSAPPAPPVKEDDERRMADFD